MHQSSKMRSVRTLSCSIVLASTFCIAQGANNAERYLKSDIGLSDQQIQDVRDGKVFVRELESKDANEIFMLGAVYVRSTPEKFIQWSADLDRLRKSPGFLAVGAFSAPPQTSDLDGYSFTDADLESLKNCKLRDCGVQMPESSIEQLRSSIDWSAPDAREKADQQLQRETLSALQAYQWKGDAALRIYQDKKDPVDVGLAFRHLMDRPRSLPKYVPELFKYLIDYPDSKPPETQDTFYWSKVDFGLKPTLRVIHMVTMRRERNGTSAYVSAEKQIYASHYFRSALSLTFCVPGRSGEQGCYLIKTVGSAQGGMTGFKGNILRKKSVKMGLATLKKSLESTKVALESEASPK